MENPLFNPKDLGISKELRPGVGLHKLFCISLMTDIFFLGGKKSSGTAGFLFHLP